MTFEGAIFDLDGTLLDSMPFWDNIASDYLIKNGITPPGDLKEILKPLSFAQTAQYFIDELCVPYSSNEIIEQVNAMVEDKYKNKIPLKPYSKEFIDMLNNMGIKLCVATAMDFSLAKAALKRTGIFDQLDFLATCATIGYAKDTPDFFLNTAKKLKVPPSKTIVFEDALHAVLSAKKAGFFVAGVYDKSMEKDSDSIRKYSDIYITSFEEMKKYL